MLNEIRMYMSVEVKNKIRALKSGWIVAEVLFVSREAVIVEDWIRLEIKSNLATTKKTNIVIA